MIETNRIPRKYHVAKVFHEDEDPGTNFEMSEWFDYSEKSPDIDNGSILVLVKLKNGEIFKAIYFPMGENPVRWCTWKEGYSFASLNVDNWAYIRHIDGEDRKDVTKWSKVRAEKEMS